MPSLSEKALQFRQLHRGPNALVLVNVWDVASARVVEDAGFPALATTSAGIAFSLGYPDGECISREEMVARVARIVRAVAVPVSADIEAGYGSTLESAAATARALIGAGAVGMNLEDTTRDPDRRLLDLPLAIEKIKAVRAVAADMRVPLVVNARTDVYLMPGDPDAQYAEALRRLTAFRDAGADCVFAPGLKDAATIGHLVSALQCPLNIIAMPGVPPIPELEKLGVARVSLGSGPMRAGLGLLRQMADELKSTGTFSALDMAIPGPELNQLLGQKVES